MIQMRWLTRKDDPTRHSPSARPTLFGQERVLQFRVEEGPKGEQWWGEWQDVPEETEE